MIFLGFPIFLVFLSAIPFFGAVCLKYRPERLFAAGLLLNGLVFYFACAANVCNPGFHALFAANLALYVPALLKLRRDKDAFRRFFTPGVQVIYIALATGFLPAVLLEHFFTWDEYSHWGYSAKLLFDTGKLNCRFSDLLIHASYPPGLPVLDVLVHKCFFGVPFQECLPRFAVRAARICLVAFAFGDNPIRKSLRECAVAMLLFWIVSGWFFPVFNFSCESDCTLGVVFAAAVYVVMRHDRSWRDDLLLALLCAWLILIKKAGMGFAVMVQLLYIVRWIADWRSGEKTKRPVWSAIVVLAAPFVMQASWSLLLKLHHTTIVFPVGKISIKGIFRLIAYGEPAYGRQVLKSFGGRLAHNITFLAVAAVALIWYRRGTCGRPRRSGDLQWFLPAALGAYLVVLFLTYMFIFGDIQARALVSFDRYFCGFMIMPLTLVLMLTSSGRPKGNVARKAFLSYPLIAVLLIATVYLYIREVKLASAWIAKVFPKDRAALDRRYGVLRAPGTRFAIVSGTGVGMYKFMFDYAYGPNFVDELLVPPPEWENKRTPAELREFCRKVDYVLIVHPSKELNQDYAGLWETPPAPPEPRPPMRHEDRFVLFKVTPEGKLRAVPADN